MAKITTGDRAPQVTFSLHTGERRALESYRGHHAVVVYFYPKDYTPICTREACAFRDAYEDFVDAGAVVIGVSADSDQSHRSFAQFHRLPFLLASDVDDAIRNAFAVPKTLGILPGRVTYIIDKQGTVRHVFNAQFLGERHVKEALEIVRELVGEVTAK